MTPIYTEPGVEDLGITDICRRMARHTESYQHLGEVPTYVQDMRAVWDRGNGSRP